jgi:phosphate transport system substrate-binding protein
LELPIKYRENTVAHNLRSGRIVTLSIGIFSLLVSSCSHAPSRGGPILINVAGSTFGYPIYSKWFSEYRESHPNVELNYASIGSGGGIQQLRSGTVDIGASDMALNDKLLATFKDKIIQFATVMGGAVPFYDIPGVNASLNFTPKALAGIYLGKITRWNDPAIARPNPGVKLPNKKIITVHRSDGSGTTFMWTDYLSKVSPEWKEKVGSNTSVNWPVGLGGKGSEGVSGLVQETPYSIGYDELIYALQNHILYGSIENRDGKFIKATLETVTAAAAADADEIQRDIRTPITDAPGPDSYPVSSFTYYLVPEAISNPAKEKVIKDFLHWMLTDGQKDAEPLGYAPLPQAVVTLETGMIDQIH